jgi:hypothetical protein
MGLLASVVVSTLPMLPGTQLDADARGQGVLAWSAFRGDQNVLRILDVADGRPRGHAYSLWRTAGYASVGQLDVAPSGAAIVCFDERKRRRERVSRVRVVRRLPGRGWMKPALIAAPRGFADTVSCGIGNAGEAVVAWNVGAGGPSSARFLAADGTVEAPIRLGAGVNPPQATVAPDGRAVVVLTDKQRALRAAVRPPGGPWSVRAVTRTPAYLPALSEDGTLGWTDDAAPRLETGPLTTVPDTTLATLSSSARGDTLATWITHASGYPRGATRLQAVVRRPGGAFSAPVTLGRLAAYPLTTALAPDGTGAAAWVTGTQRRPRFVARVLKADGSWGAQRPVSRSAGEADLAPAPGGRATIAWWTQRGRRETLRIGLVTDIPR